MLFVSTAQAQNKAAGNTPAGQGKVSICKEIDDDWKCVGQSNEWAANSPFNVLFENPAPVGVDFIGIVFYKQGADGKDVEFINEYQQNIGEKNTQVCHGRRRAKAARRNLQRLHHRMGKARTDDEERQPDRVFREDSVDGEVSRIIEGDYHTRRMEKIIIGAPLLWSKDVKQYSSRRVNSGVIWLESNYE